MQVAIGPTLAIPDLAEVPDHVAHAGLRTMTGILLTQETDHLPMFGVDVQPSCRARVFAKASVQSAGSTRYPRYP